MEDGLPMNSVLAITQTPEGYLWVGTEAGLARFDGLEFEVFDHENTPALSKSLILSLMVSRDGILYAGTRGGGLVRFRNGNFEAFTTQNGLLSDEVWTTMESGDGTIWIGTRNGINILNEGKLIPLPLPADILPHNVRALCEDRFGRVWVGTRGCGLFMVRRRGRRFEVEHQGPQKLKVSSILEDRSGALWVGTLEKGVIRIRGGKQFHFTTRNGLANNYVTCLHEDRAGNLWLGTYGGGLNVVCSGTNRVSVFSGRGDLSSQSIYSIYEDREKILWIGTEGGGLNSLKDTKITTYTMKNDLSSDIVFGLFQDSRGRIWVGTTGFGVNYFQDGRFHPLTGQDNLSADSIISITEQPAGCLWFGTLGGGINRLWKGRVSVFTTVDGLSDNFVRALYADKKGNLWAGTDSGGVHRFFDGSFILHRDLHFRVNSLLVDSRGFLWVGTWGGGLCRLKDGETKIFDKERGLSDNIVMCLHEDEDGILWAGTYGGGLNRIDDGQITQIGKKDGLPDDTIYCILEDRNRYLWMSSNRGIFCVRHREIEDFIKGATTSVRVTLFGKEDGMKSSECNGGNQPAGWQSRDGRIWFPTTKGVSVIDPDNLMVNTLPPPVQIKKIIIDGAVYTPGSMLEIPPGKGNIEIHYLALSFIVPERVLFKYKFEGVDAEWVDAGTSRIACYNAVPPGRYRFRVIAGNSDGIWNNKGAACSFRLQHAFYQTLLFKTGFPVVVLLFFFFSYHSLRKYVSYRKRRNKYKSSTLTPGKAEEYLRKILLCIEREKIYRDERISLNSFSKKLKISPRILSRIINEHLLKSFYELINFYRIREAREMLTSLQMKQKSILEIGYEVGFNSKSAFNRAFKKFTGLTPSRFRKEYAAKSTGS